MMTTRSQRMALAITVAALMLFFLVVRADAFISVQVSSNQDGFQLEYKLPFMNFGAINLAKINDERKINFHILFIRLISMKLSLTAIKADATPPSLTLHYELIGGLLSRFMPAPLRLGDIPVPFMEAGLRATLFGKKFRPQVGGNDAEASLLLTKHTTQYEVVVDMPKLQASWDGEATPDNNTISEKVTVNGLELADINFTLKYTSGLFTMVSYDIKITPALPTGEDPGDNATGDNATIKHMVGGPIPVPNGSYSAWFNMVK